MGIGFYFWSFELIIFIYDKFKLLIYKYSEFIHSISAAIKLIELGNSYNSNLNYWYTYLSSYLSEELLGIKKTSVLSMSTRYLALEGFLWYESLLSVLKWGSFEEIGSY